MRKAAALAAQLLVACGQGGSDQAGLPPPAQAPAFDLSTLCVSSACGSKAQLLDIPGAENSLFTPDGRLFVSGSENVYEITRDATGWHAAPLLAGSVNFGGLAQLGDVLYANGFDGQLYAARLTARPELAPIHPLGLAAPNGLSTGPDGELYIVNGPLGSNLPDPKIVQLRLDPTNPMHVQKQTDWLTTGPLTFPNGIQRRGRTLYFTVSETLNVTFGAVHSVEILADGSAGAPHEVGSFDAIADDFGLAGDGFLIAYYGNGQIALMGADGGILDSTDPLSFENPSSVKLGRPPPFAPDELVVTEKGVVGLPPTPGYGSKLSVFARNP